MPPLLDLGLSGGRLRAKGVIGRGLRMLRSMPEVYQRDDAARP